MRPAYTALLQSKRGRLGMSADDIALKLDIPVGRLVAIETRQSIQTPLELFAILDFLCRDIGDIKGFSMSEICPDDQSQQ